MGYVLSLLRRVPTWVWLFLATTQVLSVVSSTNRASELAGALDEMPASRARDKYQELLWDNQVRVVVGALLGPIFLGPAAARYAGPSFARAVTAEPGGTPGRQEGTEVSNSPRRPGR